MDDIKIGELTVDITASTSKLRANLAQASSLIRDWSLLSQGLTGGVTSAFEKISSVGIRALQVGLGSMAATFTLTAKAGADFEDEMVRAFTILKESSNVTSDSFVHLTNTARVLGRDTLFSAIDAAEGMQILAKAGFATREIMDSIRPTLDLAVVGNMELARSADFVIAALRGFNLETNKASKVSDILALGSSKANTTVEELGNALSYVAPVAAGAGLSMEETAAAIGILSNAGIRGCYDDKTEVLTIAGFKKWQDVTMEDVFATLNPNTHDIEYQKSTGLVNSPYKGKMYVVKNKHIDLKVTPNHWMYVKRRGRTKYERIKAEDLFGKESEYLVTGNWTGNKKNTIILEGFEQNRGNWTKKIEPLEIDMDIWVEFLGYYLSEGHCDINKGSYRISITQNKGSTFDSIKKCLDKLPFHYNIIKSNKDSYKFIILNQQLYKYISKFGNCYNKYIPTNIKNLGREYLSILYEAFRKGDGDEDGKLYTSSIKLRDDFEEVLLKLGFGAKHAKVIEKGQEHIIDGKKVYSRADGWIIYINKKQLTPSFCQSEYNSPKHSLRYKRLGTNIIEKWEDYDGRIYCAEVPNHLLIVRRNGKNIVCGNSRAGTTLRRALSQLLAPTGRAKTLIKELNLSFVDGEGQLKPFVNIIRQLNEAGINASQAMEMFGLRAGPGMIALMKGGAQNLGKFENALKNSEGAALRMSQNFRTTVKGRIRDLMASIIDLGLAFSEQFRKPLADSIFAIRNFVVGIVNTGNRMGLFKAIVKGVRSALEPIIEVVGELSKKFKDWIATLTPQKVADFFSNIREKIVGFIESIREGELGTIIKNTFDMIIKLGKGIVTIFGLISKAWSALPKNARELIGPIMLITAGFLTLFGGLTNIVFLVISLKAIFGAIGLKISLGATLLAVMKAILVAIMWVVGIIAAAIAGWKLGGFIAELSIVKGYFAGLAILIGGIGPTLKLAAMGMLAFSQPLRLLNKEFRADWGKTIEDIKIKASAMGEIDWFGTKGKNGKKGGEAPISGAEKGGMSIGIGGSLVDIGSFLGTEFEPLLADIVAVSGKSSEDTQSLVEVLRKLGIAVTGTTKAHSNDIKVLKSELYKIITSLEGVTRQVNKPEADRKNKSRIGASLE